MKESGNGNRWLMLFAGTIMLLFLGLIYAWSIFNAPFKSVYPTWTVSQLSMTFTISMIFFCLSAFVAGNLAKKISVKKVLWIAAVMLFIGFVGVSMLNPENHESSLILLYILYGFFGGSGVGMGYNSIISTVNKSFADRAGLASGIMLLGFGLGGIVLGSLVNSVIEKIGLFTTFRILGIAIAAIVFIGAAFIKPPAVDQKKAEEQNAAVGYTAGEMMREKTFWIFVIWTVLLNSASLLVINSAASIAVAFGIPATLGLIVSLFNGVGRVVHGAFFDRFREKKSTMLNNSFVFLAGLLLTLGAVFQAAPFILLGLIFSGLGYGGTPTLASAVILDRFGPKNFAVNFSIANFSLIPAAIIGPMISSALIEKSGGAYNSTFWMIIILAAVAMVLRLFLKEQHAHK
ncbi:MFS transporter [Anaerotignum sp.]|uniref:MFS transporter n=1 Tax=Anaerotignum sp. TaxID=2039241 RepID=UPI00373509ED